MKKPFLANKGAIGLSIAGADTFQIIASTWILATVFMAKADGKEIKKIEVSDEELKESLIGWDLEPSDENIQKIRNHLK